MGECCVTELEALVDGGAAAAAAEGECVVWC